MLSCERVPAITGRTCLNRSLTLIAFGAAAALAIAIVVVGTTTGGDSVTSAADQSSPDPSPASGRLATDGDRQATEAQADKALRRRIRRLEAESAADPADTSILVELGDAYVLGERLRQAARAFGAALRLHPDDSEISIRLALVWQAQGASSRALRTLKSVVAAHPDNQGAHYALAIVFYSEGDVVGARHEWETAARIDPSTSIGQRSRSFVDLLEEDPTTPASGE